MNLLVSASLIASFLAGVAALFAPCCVTVLLPTYLASIFKERSTIFLMTFIYFLGVLTVFMPIGLGAVFIAQLFSSFHNVIFSLGAVFLISLGAFLLLGRTFALPVTLHPQLRKSDLPSVYLLGVFSGVATSCCAPVLAGVLALSILPGSVFLGAVYTLAYVLGMVTPLFILSLLIDRSRITQKLFIFRRAVSYTALGRKVNLTLANLFSGAMFLAMGSYILYLAVNNNLSSHSDVSVSINLLLTQVIDWVSSYTKVLPEPVWAVVFLAIFGLIVRQAWQQLQALPKEAS